MDEKERIEIFQSRRRKRWRINAVGWGILCLDALIYLLLKNTYVFCAGLMIGAAFIAAGILYSVKYKLYRCPLCDGFIFHDKCLGCGKRWVTVFR